MTNWEENKHPRDEGGKFTNKEGGNNKSFNLSDKSNLEHYSKRIEELQNKMKGLSVFSDERTKYTNEIVELRNKIDAIKKENAIKPQQTIKKIETKPKETLSEEEQEKEDYMMAHRPTETGITADNIANQKVKTPMPKDIYEKWFNYFGRNDESVVESMRALEKVKNNPNATITIYRATSGNTINDGDWVTLSKSYAEKHNQHSLDNKGNILKMEVPVKDIQFAGDSINEWGYFPKEQKEKEQASKLFGMPF